MEMLTMVQNFEGVGLPLPLQPLGPLPLGDSTGLGIAIGMQLKSITAKGQIVQNPQFATVRGVRSTASLNWQSSPFGMGESSLFAKGKGQVRPTSCSMQSDWFYYFCLGMELRMGSQAQPDHSVQMGALVHLLNLIKVDNHCAEDDGFVSDANYL